MNSIFGENDPQIDKDTGEREPAPETLAQLKGGANWFYWIAGLSLLNSLIFAFEGQLNFIAGLAFPQLIDAVTDVLISQGAPSAFRGVGIVLDLIIVAAFALIGYYANKAVNAVFVGGMALYLLDAIVLLFLNSFLAFGFHIFALIMIFRGFMASREINRIRTENAVLPFAVNSAR